MRQHTAVEYKEYLEARGQQVTIWDPHNQWQSLKHKPVEHLTYDSRQVRPGTLFVCKGVAFKKTYLLDSAAAGATLYVSETAYDAPIPGLIVTNIRQAMPLLADLFFHSPQKKLTLIGVTGTKGKTTTVIFLKSILNHYFAQRGDKPVGIISTIGIYDGLNDQPADLTTPESIVLFSHLANAVTAGLTHVVIECSSQALKYNRLDELEFDYGIFLNIDNDHISPREHSSFADYLAAKMRLFEISQTAIYSLDSRAATDVQAAANRCPRHLTFSTLDPSADLFGEVLKNDLAGLSFSVSGAKGRENHSFHISQSGRHNLENALAAVACCRALGMTDAEIQAGLTAVSVPGRMEVFYSNDRHIACIVDFAHNRLSFKAVITGAREVFPDRLLIPVFGTIGERSFGRGPEMAETIIELGVDFAVITDDDPGTVPPDAVRRRITQPLDVAGFPYLEIAAGRDAAIRAAIEYAGKLETPCVVLLLGRGDATNMLVGSSKIPYPSDREIAEQALDFYNRSSTVTK